MIKGIGKFISSLRDDTFPAPQELVVSDPRLNDVADYLDRGITFERYRGYSWCRFDCGIDVSSMGHSDLTDGLWVWPEGLSHYLRFHSVGLPENFILHALSDHPILSTSYTTEPDYSDWIDWSSTRRSPLLATRLAKARIEDERQAHEVRQEFIADLTKRHGTSDVQCLFSGCNAHALSGMRICALHTIPSNAQDQFHRNSMRLLREALSWKA